MKTCRDCSEVKTERDFDATGYINKDGVKTYKPVCKQCRAKNIRVKYRSDDEFRRKILVESSRTRIKNKDSIAEYKKQHYIENKSEILANNAEYRAKNKEAIATRLKERRKSQPEKFRAWYKTDYDKNKEVYKARAKAWSKLNRDKCNKSVSNWSKNNPDKNAAKRAKRRSKELNATPVWADFAVIGTIYSEAKMMTDTTGAPYEVDHVIPLQNKNICGLHVEANLQVITRDSNRVKSNKFKG